MKLIAPSSRFSAIFRTILGSAPRARVGKASPPAINTAHNHVSSEISLAQAAADQTIVQSRKAVEIETLRAQAEVEPLVALAEQIRLLKASGTDALRAYVRNLRVGLFHKSDQTFMEVEK